MAPATARGGDYYVKPPAVDDTPEPYRAWLGRISEDKSIPALRQFLEQGGSILTLGTSTNLAYHLGVPVRNALGEMGRDNKEHRLPREKFYVPGSILTANVDNSAPLAWGMERTTDVYFANSPVFQLTPEAVAHGVRPAVWFGRTPPLRSGWAWGQSYIADGIAALEVPVGAGKLYLLGPEVTFRAGTHGTFKLFFNGLYLSTAKTVQ
jgi:hypothetical protein